MKVSCLCPTFNRAANGYQHLLEEAIQSFLQQDYTDAELLIGNDCPDQMLCLSSAPLYRRQEPQLVEDVYDVWCSIPTRRVRILNFGQRCRSLSEKYDTLARHSVGELICPWEDDDISLPHRLSASVARLGEADYYNPQRSWFFQNGQGLNHAHPQGYNHNCSLFTRAAFCQVGGYGTVQDGSQDAAMDTKLRQQTRVAQHPPLPEREWFYVYRWGVSNCHFSAFGGDFYSRWAHQNPCKQQEVVLRPHWRQDYVALTQRYCDKHQL